MFLKNKTVLLEKIKESMSSTLPITGIVFFLCFIFVPIPNDLLMAFIIGAVMLVVGMGLFTLGADLAMMPIGEHVGATITKTKKIWLILFICFLVGTIITVSEPDLQVLAEQVPNIPNMVIVFSVAIGVGTFLVVAILRILFNIRLSYLLIGLYAIVFGLSIFVPKEFLSVAFDSGGVTTGPMTVPFIMSLGAGIASIRSDKNAENDSFGLVALCSIGPIIAVMVLGLLYHPQSGAYTPVSIPSLETSQDLWRLFVGEIPKYLKEVAFALLPIALFFFIFQILQLKLHRLQVLRICSGLLYTYFGLVLFLCGVNVGFMPVGNYIGRQLGALDYSWIVIPIGMLIGYFIVAAEPAVHVLNRQVYEITAGAIPKKAMSISLSIGVAASVGLSMLRIVFEINIMYILVPGYLLAIVFSFFSPPLFTAIAFDSGGVASGPMTATFLLPLAMGVCTAMGGDVVTDAFGAVATVAMTPLLTIQVLGICYKAKKRRKQSIPVLPSDMQIIEMEEENSNERL